MKIKYIIISLIFLLTLTSCADGADSASAPRLLDPEGITYDTAVVRRDTIAVVNQYNAFVKSYNEALYFTKSSLNIKSIDVLPGDYVKAGDVIATLDTKPLDLQIEKQEGIISDLRKQYNYAAEMKNYDIQIATVELDGLYLSKSSSNKIEQKKFQLEKLRLELSQLYETQQYEINRQHEVLESLKKQLVGTVLTAPFDGCIVHMEQLYPGNTVAPYNPVAYISDDNRLYVKYSGSDYFRASGLEKIIGRIENREYELEYVSIPMDEYFRYIFSDTTPPVTFNFIDVDDKVEPGQFVSITTISQSAENVLTIPINSIYYGEVEEGAYVYVMENSQKLLRKVELGIRNDSMAEVISGLQEGDEVFVKQ